METGREFQTDGAAVLKERLPKEVCLNGTCSSGADDDRNRNGMNWLVVSCLGVVTVVECGRLNQSIATVTDLQSV